MCSLRKNIPQPPRKALTELEASQNTINDVRKGKDPVKYVSEVILHTRDAGIRFTEAAQLTIAFEYIRGALRRDIPRPTQNTTINSFVTDIRYAHDNW